MLKRSIFGLLAFLVLVAVPADASNGETRKYVHAFDGQPLYLDAHFDLGLLCDRAGLGYGVGGVCFDVPADAERIALDGSSLAWGVPAAVLWWVDAEGAHLRSDTSCLFDLHDVPERAARIMIIVFQPAEWNGCRDGTGAFGLGVPGPTGEGRITAYWNGYQA